MKISAVVAASILLATGAVACGGDEDSNSTSASTPSSVKPSAKSNVSQGNGKTSSGKSESKKKSQGGGPEGKEHSESGGGNAPSRAEVSTPLKVSGGGSEQYVKKGDDNSIQEFGEEADETELEEVAKSVHDFYVARAKGDWAGACSHIAKPMTEKLEQLAATSTTLEDKSCPSFLQSFTSPLTPAEWREVTQMDAGSLRRDGEQAFLIYTGVHGIIYSMPLAQEDGEWKVTTLAASVLG